MNLQPRPNETQAEHFDRCFQLASGDTDEKTAAVLRAWRESRGGDRKADNKFSPDKFVMVPDKVAYAEHDFPRSDGKVDHYDREALVAIAENMNRRARDTGDYPPIIYGHTPSPEAKIAGQPMPAICGYQANFRVAKIGNENERYSIVCDEYHHSEDAPKLRKMPRRSVEIWLDPDIKKRYWDPCAALGAETPRLDLGLGQLHKMSSGLSVAKYEAAAALPGGSNGFIPGVDAPRKAQKERYMAPEEMQALVQQLVPQIIAALKAEAMGSEPAAPAAPAAPAPTPEQPAKMGDGEIEPEKKPEEMAKMGKSAYETLVAKYQREARDAKDTKAKYAAIEKANAEMAGRLAVLEGERTEAIRKADYAKLAQEGYVFDLAKELELTKDYSDAQFEKHVNDVVKANYSQLGPRNRFTVPGPDKISGDDMDARKKAAALASKAVLQARAAGEKGEKANYDAQLAHFQKQLGIVV